MRSVTFIVILSVNVRIREELLIALTLASPEFAPHFG
jgi:hypothetical protein